MGCVAIGAFVMAIFPRHTINIMRNPSLSWKNMEGQVGDTSSQVMPSLRGFDKKMCWTHCTL